MDIPQPPPDEEKKNIIDRLAIFVARNGLEFENMTKQKQRDNPKFQFLFGGENFGYYTYKVTSEQAVLKQQSMRQQQQQQIPIQLQPQLGSMINPQLLQRSNSPLNRFNQFDQQHMHPTSVMQGVGQQRFERPPFQQSGFGQMNIERAPGPSGDGFQNLDRGQQHPPGFGSGQAPNSQMRMQMQGFGQNQPSHFERFPGHRFDGPRFDMHQSMMMAQGPRFRPAFEPPANSSPSRFDQRPQMGGDFERAMTPVVERNTSVYVNPNFDPQKLQLLQHSTQLPINLPPIDIEPLLAQRKGLEEQIQQSEKNLTGQQQVLLSQHQGQLEDALRKVQDDEITELAAELKVDIGGFSTLLQVVMDTCTKESIANGKGWIFLNTSTKRHYDLINLYLLRRVTDPNSNFLQRLHVIYLVNDTLHHCVRKGAEDMQLALEKMVVPMFCFAKCTEGDNEENVAKLNKLLTLWESKPNYMSKFAVEKLKNYAQSWSEYKNELIAKHAPVVTQIANSIQKTFESYQNQHLIFVNHVQQSIKQLDQKIEDARIQQQKQKSQEDEMRFQQEQMRHQEEIRKKQEELRQQEQMMRAPQQQSHQVHGLIPLVHQGYQGQPASSGMTSDPPIPDLSRPPPGFNNPVMVPEVPRLPYYELPAGLMVPLVKPEDDGYRPIDPSQIRLPPPCPPSERLLHAIEAFYGPPSHDNPRDSEGWERLGLYEYYKTKNLARKQKEDDIREGRREKSRSPSPIRRELSPGGRSPPARRRYRSKSPSPSPKRKRSRSRSPRRTRKRRSRSRSRSPRRSPTPPSFGTMGLGMERSLDESNKGHQLLKKMGWGGTGLGINEQGIEAPIKGGELRDRVDQYKGVGVNLQDPFESYRKTKGQAFVERMRARTDERP